MPKKWEISLIILNSSILFASMFIIYRHGILTAFAFNSVLFIITNGTSQAVNIGGKLWKRELDYALPGSAPLPGILNPLPSRLMGILFTLLAWGYFSGITGNRPPYTKIAYLTARDGRSSGIVEVVKGAIWLKDYPAFLSAIETKYPSGYEAKLIDGDGRITRIIAIKIKDKGLFIIAVPKILQLQNGNTGTKGSAETWIPATYYSDTDLDGLPDGIYAPATKPWFNRPIPKFPYVPINKEGAIFWATYVHFLETQVL